MADVFLSADGEFVSREWALVIHDARADGVYCPVTEGRRTLIRQQYFWNCGPNGCCCCNNCNLAARPSIFAPHIRVGRIDHAVDFGNDEDIFDWLQRNGLHPVRTVGGESWHIEVSAANLRAYWRKHNTAAKTARLLKPLPKHVEVAAKWLLHHRKVVIEQSQIMNKQAKTGKGPKYKRAQKVRTNSIKWRDWWRKRVEGQLRRSRKANTKHILRLVLKDRDGVL
jgi:hypothetical protein